MALFIICLNSIASFVSFYIPLFYCFLYLFSFLPLTTCTAIEMEENKVKRSIKELIKKGDKKSASISINDPGSSSFPLLSPTLFPSLLPSFPLSPCPLISILIFLIVKNILAKEMVRSKKAKERIYTSRATLNSVGMQLQQQLCIYHSPLSPPHPAFTPSPLVLFYFYLVVCFILFCYVLLCFVLFCFLYILYYIN